jgi:WD40 repeat protein
MKSQATRHIFQILLSVLLALLTSACQDQKRDLIAYWPLGDCGQIISLDNVQFNPIETDICIYQTQWSPDRKRIVLTGRTEVGMSVWIANTDSSDLRQVSSEFDQVTARWLNNNFLLVNAILGDPHSASTSTIMNYTLDLRDGTVHIYSRNLQLSIVPFAGNRWLALERFTGMQLYTLGGNTNPILQEYDIDVDAFDVAPAGDEMVFVTNPNLETSHVYRATLNENSVIEHMLVYTLDGLAAVRWSPNGQYVAVLNIQGDLHIFDATDFSLVNKFDIGGLEDKSFIWSPHSDAIAVSRRYGEFSYESEIATVDISTGVITQLTDNETPDYVLDWQEIGK